MRLCGVVRVCLLAVLMASALSGGQVTLAQTQSSDGMPLRKQTAPKKDVGAARVAH